MPCSGALLRFAPISGCPFGFGDDDFFFNNPSLVYYDATFQGDQIRGSGYTHDGSKDTPMRFFNAFL